MKPMMFAALLLITGLAPFGGASAAASTPVGAVRLLVSAITAGKSPCSPSPYNPRLKYLPSRGCPVTLRLSHRLRTARIPNADSICRCQNTARMSYVSNARDNTAFVTATWSQPAPHPVKPLRITFVVVRRSGKWLIDDTYCAGKPSTTIYKTPIPFCT